MYDTGKLELETLILGIDVPTQIDFDGTLIRRGFGCMRKRGERVQADQRKDGWSGYEERVNEAR
jgi:hypothetical protein